MPVRESAGDEATVKGSWRLFVFHATILLGAFLLFQIELIISKYLLPWFGGTAALWTTTMLVFQVLLFAGYFYAHLISTRLAPSRQFQVHTVLVAVSLAAMALCAMHWPSPVTPGAAWKPQNPEHPELAVVLTLAASVALPFFILSTIGPLLQNWFARLSERSPYPLYAVSNAGSLLGLISYPTVVEPLLKLRLQSWIWSVLYALCGTGICTCAAWAQRAAIKAEPNDRDRSLTKPTISLRLWWVVLSASSSVALLATTNMLSQYIAAVPLIWTVPLCIYLISFVISFGRPGWYKRGFYHALFAISSLAVLLAIASGNVWVEVAAFAVLLLAICMVCHGEVVRLKPAPEHVTSFYLSISAGGALGGILVGVIAPAVLNRLWEFEFSIIATGVLLLALLFRERNSWLRRAPAWLVVPVLLAVFLVPRLAAHLSPEVDRELRTLNFFPVLFLLCVPVFLSLVVTLLRPRDEKVIRPVPVMAVVVLLLLAQGLPRLSWGFGGRAVAKSRGFYGVLEVRDYPDQRMLLHGKTVHGAQWKSPIFHNQPGTYYGDYSGIGRFLRNHPKRNPVSPMRIGVIGLGVGTLAAYGLPGDYIRFYELDPAALEFVDGPRSWFSYLHDSKAKVDIVLGDGRLSLEREADAGKIQNFDLLVLDAFSGDAVPVHLLTKEAVQTYLRHLSPEGVLATHISTSALNLGPVLLGIEEEFDLYGTITSLTDPNTGVSSVWVFFSREPAPLNNAGLRQSGLPLTIESDPVLWTDDYTSFIKLIHR
jgi:hypothetical protein